MRDILKEINAAIAKSDKVVADLQDEKRILTEALDRAEERAAKYADDKQILENRIYELRELDPTRYIKDLESRIKLARFAANKLSDEGKEKLVYIANNARLLETHKNALEVITIAVDNALESIDISLDDITCDLDEIASRS